MEQQYYRREDVQSEQKVQTQGNNGQVSQTYGIVSMITGLLSFFLFAVCVNFILAVLAIVFGILQLIKGGQKGAAILGIVTGSVSIVLGIAFWTISFFTGFSLF